MDNAASSQHGSADASHESPAIAPNAVTDASLTTEAAALPPAGDDVVTDAAVAATGEPPVPGPELTPRDLWVEELHALTHGELL